MKCVSDEDDILERRIVAKQSKEFIPLTFRMGKCKWLRMRIAVRVRDERQGGEGERERG